MVKKPRVAVCFSGQPRSWKKCQKTWHNILDGKNFHVDAFCHVWNFNTRSARIDDRRGPILVNDEEINELISTINPISYLIESERRFKPENKKQALDNPAHLSQFYGIMMASHLRRCHEIENDFVYDAVIRTRYDLMINTNILEEVEGKNTDGIFQGFDLKVCTSNFMAKISDLLWFSDSITYDRISDFYLDCPSIGSKWFAHGAREPEIVFFHHLKKNGIEVRSNPWDIRIARESEQDLVNDNDLCV